MKDYDAYDEARQGPSPNTVDEDKTYCADYWCDGHAIPGQRCIDPLAQDDEDEEVCP